MESSGHHSGWISYGPRPGGKDHLLPDVRAEVERWESERNQRRGRLLCEVHVQVYEYEIEDDGAMYVAFPVGAVLGPDSDRADVAAAVARAREKLRSWR